MIAYIHGWIILLEGTRAKMCFWALDDPPLTALCTTCMDLFASIFHKSKIKGFYFGIS